MKNLLGQFGVSGFWRAKKSTLIGVGIVLVGAVVDYLQGSANQTAKLVGGLIAIPFLAYRGKLVADGTATLPTALCALLVGGLLFAAPARAQEPPVPATLCAIGVSGSWCFGILPTVSVIGIDVKHGNVVGGANIGASLAATLHPGRLDSVTLGLHASLQSGSADVPQTANLGGTVSFLKGWATVIVDWQAIGASHAVVIAPAINPLAAF